MKPRPPPSVDARARYGLASVRRSGRRRLDRPSRRFQQFCGPRSRAVPDGVRFAPLALRALLAKVDRANRAHCGRRTSRAALGRLQPKKT